MPPRPAKAPTPGQWSAIALSILVHSAIIAAAWFGWFTWRHRPPPLQTLAIEATLVDARTLAATTAPKPPEPPPPEPLPEPTPVEEQGPPKPDPAEIEKRKEDERLKAEKADADKRAAEEKAAQELKQKEEDERLDAEKVAAAKAAAEKAAAAKAVADKKAAEKKRAEDAAAAKKAAEEKVRQAREAELKRSLEAEERGNAIRNSEDAARWHAQIVARIQRAWIRPPSAQPGVECIVSVTQVPGGEVTAVKVDSCNGGDAALRESVEAAVYRASPLPSPPDPALFERNLELTFAPNE